MSGLGYEKYSNILRDWRYGRVYLAKVEFTHLGV